jgi:hypothetical protein
MGRPAGPARFRQQYRSCFSDDRATEPGALATAKLNGVEPLAWLTDVLERMVSGRTKAHELERLLPWAWKTDRLEAAVHA